MKHIRLPNGSSWPEPPFDNPDRSTVGWLLRYAPEAMTHEEQLFAATIIDAYSQLVLVPESAKNLPAIRKSIRAKDRR